MSSDRAKHWVWEIRRDLSGPAQLALLLAMADKVGDSLVCYASIETLADMALSSDRTIRRHFDDLEKIGKIKSHPRPGRTTIYQLLIPAEFGQEAGARRSRRTPVNVTGVGQSGAPASGVTDPGQNDRGDPGQNDQGVPRSDLPGARSNWPDPPVKMTDDSSLNSSLHKPSQTREPARATPGRSPGRAGPSQPDVDVAALNATATELQLEPRAQSEPLQAYQRRVGDAERQLLILQNSAARLHVTHRVAGESLALFSRRVEAAETIALQAKAAKYSAERAAERQMAETVQ